MTSIIFLVGKPDPYHKISETIRRLGHRVGIFQDKTVSLTHPEVYDVIIPVDFAHLDSELTRLSTIEIAGLVCTYENYIVAKAKLGAHFHLPVQSVASARMTTDKYLMRQAFMKANPGITPQFSRISSEKDVREFAKDHDFPLILKPANLAKSLLVTKSSSMEELLLNYRKSAKLLEATYKKYAPNQKPQLIIEEFLEGSTHSVDAFVDSDSIPHILDAVVDYQTGYEIGYEDSFHYSRILPSKLSHSQQAALRHSADLGIRALDMKSTPAHVEIIMTKSGPKIVEIGARSGGYRERMHQLANGIDVAKAIIDVATGEPPDIRIRKNESCAVLELFPKREGTFADIRNEATLRKLPSFIKLSVKVKAGSRIGKASEGYKTPAIITLHHQNASVFQKDLDYIRDEVAVITD